VKKLKLKNKLKLHQKIETSSKKLKAWRPKSIQTAPSKASQKRFGS
jgi:hypothetical protein